MEFLFDWGDTLMADLPGNTGPMCDWPTVEAMPNVREALAELCRFSRCHLATNARDSESDQIRRALERVGLGASITNVYCFRSVGHAKPSPEFFDHICRHLQTEAHELTLVGDDLEKDVMGALRSGLRAVWYNPGGRPCPPGIVEIRDFVDLPAVVAGGAV
jgi:putative hydrolase of the HAD superfamily